MGVWKLIVQTTNSIRQDILKHFAEQIFRKNLDKLESAVFFGAKQHSKNL